MKSSQVNARKTLVMVGMNGELRPDYKCHLPKATIFILLNNNQGPEVIKPYSNLKLNLLIGLAEM